MLLSFVSSQSQLFFSMKDIIVYCNLRLHIDLGLSVI